MGPRNAGPGKLNKTPSYCRETARRSMLESSCYVSRGRPMAVGFRSAKVTFEVIQGHWHWCHSIGHIRFSVNLPLQLSSPVSVINFWWSSDNCWSHQRRDLYSAARPSKRNGLITIWCDTEYLACAEPLRRAGLSAETLVEKWEIGRKSPIWTYPPLFGAPLGATPYPIVILPRSLTLEKQNPWAIVWRCLRDPTFSRFGTIPAWGCILQTLDQRC